MVKEKTNDVLAKEFYEVLLDCFDGQSPLSEAQLLSTLNHPDARFYYGIPDGGNKANSFILYQRMVDEYEVQFLAVKKAYQGKGRAGRLIAQMLSKASPVYLEVRASNYRALRLYERAGFKQISVRKGYYRNPVEDAILMKHEGYHGR